MNRRLSLLALTCLAASATAFAPAPVYKEPKPKSLLEQMRGKWVVIGNEERTVIISRDWWIDYAGGKEDIRYHWTLDPTRKPAALNLKRFSPNFTARGIVKSENDTLTVAIYGGTADDAPVIARPRNFDAKQARPNGIRVTVFSLKRMK